MKTELFDESPDFFIRNEWRKFFCQVIGVLGGNHVIYLPDSCYSISEYLYLPTAFNTIKSEIYNIYGPPFSTLQSAFDNNGYFIDYFTDIDWNIHVSSIINHPIIHWFFTQCYHSLPLRTHFPSFLNNTKDEFNFPFPEEFDLMYDRLQLDHIVQYIKPYNKCCYTSQYNGSQIIFSLQDGSNTLSVFYDSIQHSFSVVQNRVIVNEMYNYDNSRYYFIMAAGKYIYLYNTKGEFQNVDGTEITIINKKYSSSPQLAFAISPENPGTYNIYNYQLELLCYNSKKYYIYENKYCVIDAYNRQYLYSYNSSPDEKLEFVWHHYFTLPNFKKNGRFYLILRNDENKFALLLFHPFMLFDHNTWDDYKIKEGYFYMFFKKNEEWYKLFLYSLKHKRTDKPIFHSKKVLTDNVTADNITPVKSIQNTYQVFTANNHHRQANYPDIYERKRQYVYIRKLPDGWIKVKKGVHPQFQCGYVNDMFDEIVPAIYTNVYPFSEDLAAARLGNWATGNCGYINYFGEVVIPFIYQHPHKFSDGLAKVFYNNQWYFINKKGERVISLEKYTGGSSFHNGYAIVNILKINPRLDYYGIIDKNGIEVIPCIIDCSEIHIYFKCNRLSEYVDNYKKYGNPFTQQIS